MARARPLLALPPAALAVAALHWAAGADPRPGRALPDLDPAAPTGVALQRAPGHRHWHLQGLARYTLRNLRSGRVLTDRKQGFCLHAAAFASRAFARHRPHATRVALGLAPGRVDTYEPQLEGQHIAITPRTAPSGTYLLTQIVDPQRRLCQLTRANDSASLRPRVTWRRGRPLPAVRVLRACPDTPTCP